MTTVNVGKKLIPVEQIAFVEPFDPESSTRLQTEKNFGARIVLIDRESVLSEQVVIEIGTALGFRLLPEDGIATNPALHFSVETFAPSEGFQPRKPYKARLLWRDLDGNTQSKLLLTDPESALAIAVRGEDKAVAPPAAANESRARRKRTRPSPTPA